MIKESRRQPPTAHSYPLASTSSLHKPSNPAPDEEKNELPEASTTLRPDVPSSVGRRHWKEARGSEEQERDSPELHGATALAACGGFFTQRAMTPKRAAQRS